METERGVYIVVVLFFVLGATGASALLPFEEIKEGEIKGFKTKSQGPPFKFRWRSKGACEWETMFQNRPSLGEKIRKT